MWNHARGLAEGYYPCFREGVPVERLGDSAARLSGSAAQRFSGCLPQRPSGHANEPLRGWADIHVSPSFFIQPVIQSVCQSQRENNFELGVKMCFFSICVLALRLRQSIGCLVGYVIVKFNGKNLFHQKSSTNLIFPLFIHSVIQSFIHRQRSIIEKRSFFCS